MGSSDPASDLPALASTYDSWVERFLCRLSAVPGLPSMPPLLADYLRRPGKRLRPLLALAAFRAFSLSPAQPLPPGLLSLAAALEIFHNFILAHDDLIDAGETRRGGPTLHRLLETHLALSPHRAGHLALVFGDVLFSLALEAVASPDTPPAHQSTLLLRFTRLAQDTGLGEALEIRNAATPLSQISEESILTSYFLKTTRYTFAAPLQFGALFAGLSPDQDSALEDLARPVGLAFQIENDLHEIDDPHAAAADLATGVKTLLLHQAWCLASSSQQAWLQDSLDRLPAEPGLLPSILAFLRASPALPSLRARVPALFAEAARFLHHCPAFSPAQVSALLPILDFITRHRRHSEARPLPSSPPPPPSLLLTPVPALTLLPFAHVHLQGVIDLIGGVLREYGQDIFLDACDADLLRIDDAYRARGGEFIVALDPTGRVAGTHATLPLDPARRLLTFRRLYLHPAHRGTGAGRLLMDWALLWSRRHAFRRVEFWSDISFSRAHAFFRKSGFQPTGEIRTMHDAPTPYQEYKFVRDL